MKENLKEIALDLKNAKYVVEEKKEKNFPIKTQLIYALNGTGKTRLSREFKSLITPALDIEGSEVGEKKKVLYYNAFTEDLFYWDNGWENDSDPKLKIHPNIFIPWIFQVQGDDSKVINTFQYYTKSRITPHFNPQFSEVTFSYRGGNDGYSDNIKISKGEESCFIWSIFYSFLSNVIEQLNENESTDLFDDLEYVFIDDPVSSLDDNNLIELAVNLAQLIKSSKSNLKFIITTHNPLFYNVLYNSLEFNIKNEKITKKYFLKKNENGTYSLITQGSDSPFAYHIFLKNEIESAIKIGQLKKYHFNFLRNILEKTATFLGHGNWSNLLPENDDKKLKQYQTRIINLSSHSKHSDYENIELTDEDKNIFIEIFQHLKKQYKFK